MNVGRVTTRSVHVTGGTRPKVTARPTETRDSTSRSFGMRLNRDTATVGSDSPDMDGIAGAAGATNQH
jgi:hypothetical protein